METENPLPNPPEPPASAPASPLPSTTTSPPTGTANVPHTRAPHLSAPAPAFTSARIAIVIGVAASVAGAAMAFNAHRHAPQTISKELLPVLRDVAVAKRAARCQLLNSTLKAYEDAKPITIKRIPDTYPERCMVVSARGDTVRSVGGFDLAERGDCDKLKSDLEKDTSRHENNQKVLIDLSCGSTGDSQAAIELAALVELRDTLGAVVKAANEGTISPGVSSCYFAMKAQAKDSMAKLMSSRCEVMKADDLRPNMTWSASWEHALLRDEFKEYEREHQERHDELMKRDAITTFFSEFSEEKRKQACDEAGADPWIDLRAALMAQSTCL